MKTFCKLSCFLLLVAVTACSGSAPLSLTQSALVMTEPPGTSVSGIFQDGDGAPMFQYFAGSYGGEILFTSLGEELPFCLDTESEAIHWSECWRIGGTTWFVVAAMKTDETTRIYRFRDIDGDGAPDQSTRSEVLSTDPTPAYVTSVSGVDGDPATVFLLDRRCQDVWIATDTDADGWADTIETVAFALSADHDDLLDTQHLTGFELDGNVHVSSHTTHGLRREGVALFDDDGDLVADREESNTYPSLTPDLEEAPYAGQTSLNLRGGFGADGRVAEAWILDAFGADVIQLGSTTFAGTNVATVALSRPLLQGEQLALRFYDAGIQTIRTVEPLWPQMLESSRSRFTRAELATPQSILIKGVGFLSTMTVYVLGPDRSVTTVTPAVISGTEATITLPTYVHGGDDIWRTSIAIWAIPFGQPAEADAYPILIAVAPPPPEE